MPNEPAAKPLQRNKMPRIQHSVPTALLLFAALLPSVLCAQESKAVFLPPTAKVLNSPSSEIIPEGWQETQPDTTPPSADTVTATASDSSLRAAAVTAEPDDTLSAANAPFLALSPGWSLGNLSIFDTWVGGIPDSAAETRSLFGVTDTGALTLYVKEKPKGYSSYFPVSLVLSVPLASGDRVNISAGFFALRKNWKATVVSRPLPDSIPYSLEKKASLLALSGAISFDKAIPERFFSVTGMEKTFIRVGVTGYPLVRWNGRISRNGSETKTSANGIGAGWTAGMATFSKPTRARGLTLGGSLCYTGAWFGRFMMDGKHLSTSDLNPRVGTGTAGNAVSFLTHRVQLSIDIILPMKPR